MKKLLLVLAACLAFMSSAFAAVDLNTATQAELETVKGIGPAKAKAIIDYRTKNGPFRSVDDLDNVKGFGQKSIDKLRGEVSVGGGSSTKAATKSVAKPAEKVATEKEADKGSKAENKAAKKSKKTDKGDKDKPAADAKKDTGKK